MIAKRTPLRDVRPLPRNSLGLQVSLIQTSREGGKVRHENIARLGAITIPASVADRIDFWRRVPPSPRSRIGS
jgi:hypothetical protein